MHRLPPLNALRAFEAAARLLSFKQAAEELCVTPGAISRHVSNLEDYLGIRLFIRQPRSILLTDAGRRYLHEIHAALQHICQATDSLTIGQDESVLRLKAPPTFAMRWLVPRLAKFRARNPGIAVQVSTSHEAVDFETEEVDAAISYGEKTDPGLTAELLFREVLVPVCSPHHPRPRAKLTASHIAREVLLHSLRRPGDWPRWFAAAGAPGREVERSLVLENSSLTYQGAVDGLGIAIAQVAFVTSELDSGRLITPTDVAVQSDAGYFLTYPKLSSRLGKIRTLHAWMADEAASTRKSRPHDRL